MGQRVITGIVFTIVVALFMIPAYYNPLFSLIFGVIVGVVVTIELIKALDKSGIRLRKGLIFLGEIISLITVFISYNILEADIFISSGFFGVLLIIYLMFMLIMPAISNKKTTELKESLISGLCSVGVLLYVTFPLMCLINVAFFAENGWYFVIVSLCSPWISDVFAYFVGYFFGKNKVVPHISPKKTCEGCLGGAFFCGIFVMLWFDFTIYKINEIQMNIVLFSLLMFGLGILISVMSQLGDWVASLIKRVVSIKDFGEFMPGHGGMLDRFDSAFYTLPLGMLIAMIAYYL